MTTPTPTPAATPAAPTAPQHPLVRRLVELHGRDDRGALAALRRGLGKEAATAPEMFPYVEPFIAADASRAQVEAAYMVASLFGMHPHHAAPPEDGAVRQRRGFGASLARIRNREGTTDEDPGVARRFGALLNTDREGLPTHLRHLVTLLHSKAPDVPIDYEQLYFDILRWDSPTRQVQREWAAGFWRRATPAAANPENDDDNETTPED